MKHINKIVFLFLFVLIKTYAVFSEHQTGIIDNIKIEGRKTIYLTFDICGNKKDNSIDNKILDYIIKNEINTTIFINGRFLEEEKNIKILNNISKLNFISIQNHGLLHKPALIDGKIAFGIVGTKNLKELRNEFLLANEKIKNITGKDTKWFRSGTAHYDDESIKIINNSGYKIAGFSIALDEGANLSNKEIIKKTKHIKNGDILLGYINHPKKNMFLAYKEIIEFLKNNNYEFLLLE